VKVEGLPTMRRISLAPLLMLSASGLWAQTPTPAQGRDYVTPLYRVIAVDTQGRIIISPTGVTSPCPGTAATPCVVDGPDATGAAPTHAPVLNAGFDGSFVRIMLTDVNGRQVMVGPVADGATAAGNPVQTGGVDFLGVMRHFSTNSNGAQAVGQNSPGIDGESNANQVHLVNDQGAAAGPLEVFGSLFNNTTWDRARSASLSNDPPASTLTARNTIGAHLVEFGSRWVVNSSPATSSQGSASIAAEANVRHVADGVCFSAAAAGAIAATSITVTIRDGASGAGTVLRTFQTAIPVAAASGQQEVAPFCTPAGMGLVGTTNTAMTAEFSAGVTNLNESISITGYNVN